MSDKPLSIAPEELQAGDVILASANDIVARLVRRAYRTDYSHAMLVVRGGKNGHEVQVVEATPPMVIRRSLSDSLESHPRTPDVYRWRVHDTDPLRSLDPVVQRAEALVGMDYALSTVLLLALAGFEDAEPLTWSFWMEPLSDELREHRKEVLHHLRLAEQRLAAESAVTCSELVAMAFRDAQPSHRYGLSLDVGGKRRVRGGGDASGMATREEVDPGPELREIASLCTKLVKTHGRVAARRKRPAAVRDGQPRLGADWPAFAVTPHDLAGSPDLSLVGRLDAREILAAAPPTVAPNGSGRLGDRALRDSRAKQRVLEDRARRARPADDETPEREGAPLGGPPLAPPRPESGLDLGGAAPAVQGVVRLLFASSAPRDRTQVDSEEEWQMLRGAIRQGTHRDSWSTRYESATGLLELAEHGAAGVDVLHFAGHGEQAGLVLTGFGFLSMETGAAELRDAFGPSLADVHLLVINACHSLAIAEQLAPDVGCAVGVDGPLLVPHAIAFSSRFYRWLAEGRSVQSAFNLTVREVSDARYRLLSGRSNPDVLCFVSSSVPAPLAPSPAPAATAAPPASPTAPAKPATASRTSLSRRAALAAVALAALLTLGALALGAGREAHFPGRAGDMVQLAGGVLQPGRSEVIARASHQACLVSGGPNVAQRCGDSFEHSPFGHGLEGASTRVEAFALDRNEVDNAHFVAWLNSHAAEIRRIAPPQRHEGLQLRREGMLMALVGEPDGPVVPPGDLLATPSGYRVVPGREAWPVRAVTQSAAAAFCRDAGKKLPSSAQWEWAARGEAGRPFPWGEGLPACDRVTHARAPGMRCAHLSERPEAVGASGDRTPEGVQDLGGNVSEWTSTVHDDGGVEFRGGSFLDPAPLLQGTLRSRVDGQGLYSDIGFRCAK